MKIIAVGKIKKKYLLDGIEFYAKQISKLEIVEIRQSTTEKEGKDILDKISNRDYVIALDIKGKKYDSESFSKKIEELKLNGEDIVFLIGGSHGLSDEVKRRANERLSFSDFTFPHELFRLMLVEQIYRAESISQNKPYHK
ncbi:MAG TPA: 23S rRNA (pseudouridine(1915)-N(3))-methyltransferase RlmH [Acholeplasmataceae bacterium]|jgi:23S rRNA (pseudouridine1915-N3)-methyltransferase|nr:23S rRNA (pseudouridine(1915)-N(3))-methyltransferase RlmH [Acholeplasmataceae bacterium]